MNEKYEKSICFMADTFFRNRKLLGLKTENDVDFLKKFLYNENKFWLMNVKKYAEVSNGYSKGRTTNFRF